MYTITQYVLYIINEIDYMLIISMKCLFSVIYCMKLEKQEKLLKIKLNNTLVKKLNCFFNVRLRARIEGNIRNS